MKAKPDHFPPKYRIPINGDWKRSSNVECRVALERLNICSQEQEKDSNLCKNVHRAGDTHKQNTYTKVFLVDQLTDILQKCDEDCTLCNQYAHQLCQHVFQAHGMGHLHPANGNFKGDKIKSSHSHHANTKSENFKHKTLDSADFASSLHMESETDTTLPDNDLSNDCAQASKTSQSATLGNVGVRSVVQFFDASTPSSPKNLPKHPSLHFTPENSRYESAGANTKNRNQNRDNVTLTRLNPYTCDLCGEGSPNWTSLEIHKYIVHVEEISKRRRKDRLQNIIAALLNGEDVDVRTSALLSSRTGEKVITVLDNTHSIENFTCEMCGHLCNTMNDLTNHTMREHGDRDKQIRPIENKCSECEEVFLSLYNLRVHMRSHTGEKLYKCESCEHSFLCNRDLDRHTKLTHTRKKPFKCVLCGKCYATSSILNLHKRTHTREKNYRCDRCEEFFTTCTKLRYHKSNYKCLQEKSTEKINREHLNKYKCITCCKMFPTMNSLNRHRHRLQHIADTPFKCDVCEMHFKGFFDLRFHNETKHWQIAIESNERIRGNE